LGRVEIGFKSCGSRVRQIIGDESLSLADLSRGFGRYLNNTVHDGLFTLKEY
jgi:hypothetical protein